MLSVFDTSEEKTNFARLLRLVIDGGTHVLREYLNRRIVPPVTLQDVLNTNKGKLGNLKSIKKISNIQWEQLFPPSGHPPDSQTFDITLLHLLLREICGLIAPASGGWHDMPAEGDTSPEANIVRIKFFRNELCHRISTSISNVEFQDKWKKISQSLVALGFDQQEVDRLKTAPIDHDTELRIKEEVAKWKRDFEPRVEKLEKDLFAMKREISGIQGSVSEQTTHELTNCLPDEIENVFGRSEEIDKVISAIQTGKVAAVVITGGPGFGKTAVANKVGHELVANQEHTVLFCSLRSKATIVDVATSMILTCSRSHSQPPENPQHWLRNWSKQQQQKVSFILDNADEVLESRHRTEFASILGDMRMLSNCNVTFVITTRKVFKDPNLEMKNVRLPPLSQEQAKKLLVSKVLDPEVQQKLFKTDKLVQLCGCVPLALRIVGSLLLDFTEDQLIKRLEEKPLDVLQEDENDENSVEKAINASFNILSKNEQEALVLLSVFPGSFNADAAQAVIQTGVYDDPLPILHSLKNRSVLEQPASHRYQIHQLIQAFTKKIGQAKHSPVLQRGPKVACNHFISYLVDIANMYWSKDKCKESIKSFNEDRHNFEYFFQFFLEELKTQDPQQLLMRTMENLVEKFSQTCIFLEMCLLPSVYLKHLEEFYRLLTSYKQPVSKIVELLCLLGHENRKIGNQEKYKELLEKAADLHAKNPTEFDNNVSEAFFCNNYARFLSEQKMSAETKEQFNNSVKVCEQLSPEDPVQKGVTLLYSGRNDNHQNEHDQAEKKLNKALQLFQESLGNHVMTALLLKDLADFHLFHGEKSLGSPEDRQKSIKLYEQALTMMGNLGIKDQKESILTLTNLGLCYQLQGKMEEAMTLFAESLKIAERELAENHRWKIYAMTQMAYWYKENGNMVEAKVLKEKALQMSNTLLLPDHQPPNKFLLHKI